jgi:hypothetical protein
MNGGAYIAFHTHGIGHEMLLLHSGRPSVHEQLEGSRAQVAQRASSCEAQDQDREGRGRRQQEGEAQDQDREGRGRRQQEGVHTEPGDAMAGETVTRWRVRTCPLPGCSAKVAVCHTPGAGNIAHLVNHTAS